MATFSTAQDYTYKPARFRTPQVHRGQDAGVGRRRPLHAIIAERPPPMPHEFLPSHRPRRRRRRVRRRERADDRAQRAITAATASRTTTSSSSPRASARCCSGASRRRAPACRNRPQHSDAAGRARPRVHARQRRAGAAMMPAVTWIGHASILVQAGGVNVLTDPIFSERASPLAFIGPKRHVAPGTRARRAAAHRRSLISHNHYDHLDAASVRALAAQAGGPPLFIVPLGIKALARRRRHRRRRRARLVAERTRRRGRGRADARRSTGRGGRSSDRMETLWGGYAVFAPGFQSSSPATPRTRRTSPTSTSASPHATAPAAASTSRCCRSAPTSRAGS